MDHPNGLVVPFARAPDGQVPGGTQYGGEARGYAPGDCVQEALALTAGALCVGAGPAAGNENQVSQASAQD